MEDREWIPVSGDESEANEWSIIVDGYYRRNAAKQMEKSGMSEVAIGSIFSNAARILSQCPNPHVNVLSSETGIVIGKVQSGKTSNFISVLALAFDNGYNIAVVLGGNTLDLLKQNAGRISDAFQVDPERLTVLKTTDNKSLINQARIKEFIENGRKVIIVGLKHNKHISQISDIFDNEFLADEPVLIIDDEGDQATLNTKAYQTSFSKTYKTVLGLKGKLRRHCFLSVTATPQANILIETFDKLSPDFGELVYPGEGYCGLQEFHGQSSGKHVYEIPTSENNLLDGTGVPHSIYTAMAMFFVGNAIRRSRGDERPHAMLIHPSQKKYDHNVVVNKIQPILDLWKSYAKMKLNGRNDIAYMTFRKTLVGAYNAFVSDGVICAPFAELENTVLDRIQNCSPVLLCNSDENAGANAKQYKTNIFVGGNLVERGITIDGLAVTYITRRAKGKSNVDNSEQRARWFGYKSDYLDVCRVFTTKDIKDDFTVILEHDEDMWASIERAHEQGVPFKEMPRIFILASKVLQLTRRNVARTKSFGFSEWKSQKYFLMEQPIASKNTDYINAFRASHVAKLESEIHNSVQTHTVLKGKPYHEIFVQLLSHLYFREDEIFNIALLRGLDEAFRKLSIQPIVDVYWMRDVEHQTRQINDDGSIQQLFQGRNPNLSSPTYYKGDRSLVDRAPDHMQLQIHFVKPTNIPTVDFYSPALALYVPPNIATELERLVTRVNG